MYCPHFPSQNDRHPIRARNPKDEEAQLNCTNHSFPSKQQHKENIQQERMRGMDIGISHSSILSLLDTAARELVRDIPKGWDLEICSRY
ncbi:hypothetical protein CEXT_69621 [Caerostris extrusa]|uniref:Uncharacterized protein n=1 Tax=Caerostris extrusa TaxID=172846 RepID=A0AAV4TC34_CAEEX|nr:hypothetical protein CEXT_69621 [Caerostris extrusa]